MGCGCNSGRNHATATPEQLLQQAQDRAAAQRELARQERDSQQAATENAGASRQ